MISDKRHEEKTLSGEPIFVIETYNTNPNSNSYNTLVPFDGKRERVRFYQGVGRTTSLQKAKLFDEVYGYVVYLPKNMKKWEKPKREKRDNIWAPEDEENYLVDTDMPEEDEDEDSVSLEDIVNAESETEETS